MASIHFSVLKPDRHKLALFLLAAASFSGTLAGTFFFQSGVFPVALFTFDTWYLLAGTLGLLFGVFVFGFCRFGWLLIPLVLSAFSAFVSASFRKLCGTAAKIWSAEFFIPAVFTLAVFLAVFFLCTQACVVSRNFPILFSRHTRFARPQRAFYVFEYMILNVFVAVCFVSLYFLCRNL